MQRVLQIAVAGVLSITAAYAQDISVIGAEKAGNAAKTIPAWEGGLTQLPAGSKPGGPYADPFAQDKPLFSINAANLEQHKASLTPGQIELLKRNPEFSMNVYPTRRSAVVAKCVAEETAANKGKAKLVPGGRGFTGVTGGVPFPNTTDGLEMMWNTLVRYRGETFSTRWSQAAVNADGKYSLTRFDVEYDFHYGVCGRKPNEREANRVMHYVQKITAPARLAGNILLVHEPIDQTGDTRSIWNYNPGQRRVRLAPEVTYDNPGFASEGLRTADDLSLFNGGADRYDFKFAGKREVYVPYNAYRAVSPSTKLDELLTAKTMNPELLRYELHRVYVVEAKLKSGSSHLYPRRTFYIDEDSWMIVATDKYDSSGKLWRYGEMHSFVAPDYAVVYPAIEVHYDLPSARYLAAGLRGDDNRIITAQKKNSSDYTPQALRGEGTR